MKADVRQLLRQGTVIPAHPLALDHKRQIDEKRQRRLTRYYLASGAGGVAVGVHTTQFEIRRPDVGLFEPVLRMASEEVDADTSGRPIIKIAGVCGPTAQAVMEAEIAVTHGYDVGLLSMGGLDGWSDAQLIARARAVADVIPVFGFYLQPAVGGRVLSYGFWREFAEIPNVQAIKVAAFNRYQTLDVVRAVCLSGRGHEIALYTGNDDNIVADLLTPYRFDVHGEGIEARFVGELLGHWAVWTRSAVDLLNEIKRCIANGGTGMDRLLSIGADITDMNAAVFDAEHAFRGCVPGIHEVLRRQGLLDGRWCLNADEELSAGQMEQIDRVCRDHRSHTDDEFVKGFLRH